MSVSPHHRDQLQEALEILEHRRPLQSLCNSHNLAAGLWGYLTVSAVVGGCWVATMTEAKLPVLWAATAATVWSGWQWASAAETARHYGNLAAQLERAFPVSSVVQGAPLAPTPITLEYLEPAALPPATPDALPDAPDTLATVATVAPEAPSSPPEPPHIDLGANPQSALIAGVPGAGKGVFTLAALATLEKVHPDIRVFVVDPKASPKETGYVGSNRVVFRAAISTMEPDTVGEWLVMAIERYQSHDGPKLLIIDEVASVMASLKSASKSAGHIQKFRAFLSHLTSMGDSEQHYIWLISQDASCEGLGISSALRATLRAIGLLSPHNRNAVGAFLAGNWLPVPEGGRATLNAMMTQSPCNRVLFDGKSGQWIPTPIIQNLTGWDRDSRSPTTPPTPPTPPTVDQVASVDPMLLAWLRERGSGRSVREIQQALPAKLRVPASVIRAALQQL